MVQKPKAVKYKVITGYILLLAMAVLSVWLVYTEILKLAGTGKDRRENKKVIDVGTVIADLYASEAIGRNSILTESQSDFEKYSRLIDTISFQIEDIKKGVDTAQIPKFDSIQLLVNRKRSSISEIIAFRNKTLHKNSITKAIEDIYSTKDSMVNRQKSVEVSKKYPGQKSVDAMLSPRLKELLSKPKVPNDSLAMVYSKVLIDLVEKERIMDKALFLKEQKLLEENRIISDQLRGILLSIEKEFAEKTYKQARESQAGIQKTVKTVAWIGAISLLLLIIFAWVIIRDLSINQKHRRQLELLNQENEELLRTKSMLMATVTHDLQTPLGSIIGFQNLIKDSGITSKQKQYLNNIEESANYILKLVNDLLDFSKLENNKISIEKTSFNLKTSIENTCKTLEPMAVNKGIELNWDINEELNTNIVSDPYRIKQVLTNLISNAIKFTPEGSVEVTGKVEDSKIFISVIDTGIGISKKKHGAVFKEFTQAHSGIEKKFGGTGLGLTISKKILELLGGEISLESEEGQGSIFTITIPYERADSGFSEIKPEIHNTEESFPALRDKRILIVDDDATQLSLMQELFSRYPVIVQTEINASAVISLLENGTFDLVLTDIQMPSIDGFELIKLIRSNTNNHVVELPVIALSGKRDLTENDFTSNGFNGHHPKPVHLENLIALISALFGEEKVTFKTEAVAIDKQGDDKLYNLRSLSQFTYNDPESLKTILKTFIDSAIENCEALKSAVQAQDAEALAGTAHKMIPMLKQMEVPSIFELLEPLEDRNYNMNWQELNVYVNDICDRLKRLCDAFNNEINQSSIL